MTCPISEGDLLAMHIHRFEQFAILGGQFIEALLERRQAGRLVADVGRPLRGEQGEQRFLEAVRRAGRKPLEVFRLVEADRRRPRQKIGARLERVELSPHRQARFLQHVFGVVPAAEQREQIPEKPIVRRREQDHEVASRVAVGFRRVGCHPGGYTKPAS